MHSNSVIFSSTRIVLISLSFIVLIFAIGLFKKIIYYFFLKKKNYVFPRISTNGIANIAMIISISTCCILILVFFTGGIFGVLFRAYPSWRINIETMLIKIGGLLYGPIIGLFIGAITDFLTIVITAGSFHYGYFIVCILCGLISGLFQKMWRLNLRNKFMYCFVATIICILVCASIQTYIMMLPYENFDFILPIVGEVVIPKINIVLVISFVFICTTILVWILLLINQKNKIFYSFLQWKYQRKFKNVISHNLWSFSNRQSFSDWHWNFYCKNLNTIVAYKEKLHYLKTINNKRQGSSWFVNFTSILIMIMITEAIINIIVVPSFDQDFSVYPYEYWLIIRSINFVWLFPLNVIIIYPIFKIIITITHYDTNNDTVAKRHKKIQINKVAV